MSKDHLKPKRKFRCNKMILSLKGDMQQFLPCDSYAKCGICRHRVSVCVCHTPVLYQID